MKAARTAVFAIATLCVLTACGSGGGDGTSETNGLAQAVTGKDVYDATCSSCHSLSSYDRVGGPDLAGTPGATVQGMFTPDVPGHQGLTFSAGEIQGIEVWLNADFAGKAVYDDRCRDCHKLGVYDPTGPRPNLAGRHIINAHHLSGVSTDDRQHLNTWVHTP